MAGVITDAFYRELERRLLDPTFDWDDMLISNPQEVTMESPDVLRREAARLLEQAEQLESLPDDDFENGNVITFTKTMGGRTYDYAAIKAVGKWFRTGRQIGHHQSGYLKWNELLDFIGLDNLDSIHYVTGEAPLV